MDPTRPGARLGHYQLVRPLGSGAMGDVWEAELQGPAGFVKRVALKRLKAGPASDDQRDALLHEAKLGARLNHPNVVGVHALETHDGVWVVAMELVRGASVHELLKEGVLPPRALIDVGIQACAGLHHIHRLGVDGDAGASAGMVHRDIKPGNLLVDVTGLVKVADLGIAAATCTGPVMGTPGYVPPEQLDGRAEARSDLFALGATLYVCATRRRPFGGADKAMQRVRRVGELLDRPAFLGRVDEAVPGLGGVLRRCLAPLPQDRFESAAALAEALAALRQTLPAGRGLLELLCAARPDLEPFVVRTPGIARASAPPEIPMGNLPARRNAFVGRVAEVEQVVDTLRHGARLVTLVGAGGMGKTRLALQAARTLEPEFPGGAWFFDLSDAGSVHSICFALARALRLRLDPADPVAQIGWALESLGPVLLVFDNLERCVAQVPATLARWADVASDAQLLCTSRIVLGLHGERVERVGSLSVDEATALFCERAPRPIPAEHLADVRALVEAMEGLPLAVELAAARAGVMPVPMLRRRLGLTLLAGGRREMPSRHRSVEASLEWSWELLSPWEQRALSQLSVCEGGFDLEAAEAVLELPAAAGWALDVLQGLADASLIQVDAPAGRFSLGSMVQVFANERLADAPQAEHRHGAWFAQLKERALPEDLDNLTAAGRRAAARHDADAAAGCALGAWQVLERTGPFAQGIELLEAAEAGGPNDDVTVALIGALGLAGRVAQGVERARAAVAHAQATADHRVEGALRTLLGSQLLDLGRVDDARSQLRQALALHRRRGDRTGEATALGTLGAVCFQMGQLDEAHVHYRSALEIWQDLGHRRGQSTVQNNLGNLFSEWGRHDDALASYENALATHRALGHRRNEAVALANLGGLLGRLGRFDEALPNLEAALAIHRRLGARGEEARGLGEIATMHHRRGHGAAAAEQYRAAIALTREVGHRRSEGILLTNLALHHAEDKSFPLAETLYAEALEALREVRHRRGVAAALSNLAQMRLDQERPAEAATLCEEALALLTEPGDAALAASTHGIAAKAFGALEQPARARHHLDASKGAES